MGETTEISWSHSTFNPWIGCSKVSPACKFCYAEINTVARVERANGRELWGKHAARRIASESYWSQPLAWNRRAAGSGKPWRVFCASLSDVFEDHPAVVESRARLFRTIMDTPALTWMLLTKRPENAERLWRDAWGVASGQFVSDNPPRSPWLPNIWLGASVEDQERADERIPKLLAVPAAVRFLSCEPLLGDIDLGFPGGAYIGPAPDGFEAMPDGKRSETINGIARATLIARSTIGIHLVIAGGESGPHARPMNPMFVRSLRDQCFGAGVAFHFKQWGEFAPTGPMTAPQAYVCDKGSFGEVTPQAIAENCRAHGADCRKQVVYRVGKKAAGRVLDGRTWDEMPGAGATS